MDERRAKSEDTNLHAELLFDFGGFEAQAGHLEMRGHARKELTGGEGLGEVVIGTLVQPLHARLLSGARR
jgi:hypothetical protein